MLETTTRLAKLGEPLKHKCSQTGSNVALRRCQISDYARIIDMCRNVYGGTDYLPRLIEHFNERPDTTVMVAQGDSGAVVNGVMCGHKRGSGFFLFGLRVAEEARGKGLARILLEDINQRYNEHGPVQTIFSATIPEQAVAIHIFNTLGYTHTHTIEIWPSYAALGQYEDAAGVTLSIHPPGMEFVQALPSMIDFLGLQDVIRHATRTLGVDLCDWVQCSSVQSLQQAVQSIRAHQVKQAERKKEPPIVPMDYLPFVYEAFPLDSPWTQNRLVEGNIWLLPHHHLHNSTSLSSMSTSISMSEEGTAEEHRIPSISSIASLSFTSGNNEDCYSTGGLNLGASTGCSSDSNLALLQYAAVVVIGFSKEMRRYCAGVMTADDAYIPAAMEFATSRLPHVVCFFDRGSRHSSGKPDPNVILPELLTSTGKPSTFLMYARSVSKA